MTDTQHEAGGTDGPIMRLTPGEIIAILAFWAFLVVLTAAGLLIDPRVAAVAAMRAALRPDVTSGVDKIALVEYGLWALLTLPIFWMTRRFGGDRPTLDRVLIFLIIGVVLAIGVDALLKAISRYVLVPATVPGTLYPACRVSLPAPRPSRPLRPLLVSLRLDRVRRRARCGAAALLLRAL